jgi:hypothetical protein
MATCVLTDILINKGIPGIVLAKPFPIFFGNHVHPATEMSTTLAYVQKLISVKPTVIRMSEIHSNSSIMDTPGLHPVRKSEKSVC